MSDVSDLRAKIDEAKALLPMPSLMRCLGYDEKHIGKSALCPFHDDQHPSFSVFHSTDGKGWQWKCHVGCGYGDQIAFLVKHFGISRREAIRRFLEMAGFPVRSPSKSREYPKSHASPACRVSPVSEGQGTLDKEVKALAAQNACTQLNTARTRRFKFLGDLKAVEKRIKRKLQVTELGSAFDEWHRISLPFLDPAKTRDYYEAKFLSEYSKRRFATGEGTLTTALENIANLAANQLPVIPGKQDAAESWRRLAALHRELSRLRGKPTHFLAYRDAAKVFDGMSHQEAHAITGALVTLGVIEIASNGQPGVNSKQAAEFRYLLAQTGNSGEAAC